MKHVVGERVKVYTDLGDSTNERVGKVVGINENRPLPYIVEFADGELNRDGERLFPFRENELASIDRAAVKTQGSMVFAVLGHVQVTLTDLEGKREQLRMLTACIEALDDYVRVRDEQINTRKDALARSLFDRIGYDNLTELQQKAVDALVEKEEYEGRR